jgi:hypothetical protein
MRKSILAAVCALACSAGFALAQQGETQLIDILKVKVRPDKTMEYENAIRKLADINRKKGEHWIAFSTEYGDSGTIYFSSLRAGYGDIENGFATMQKAMMESLGTAGRVKMFADLNGMSVSGTAEIRRRRWDLSVNPPPSREEAMKIVATSRWIRSLRIDIRPGRMPEFIEAWKPWQSELSRVEPRISVWASIAETGSPAVVLAAYYKSLKEIDAAYPGVQKAMKSDTYRSFSRSVAELASMTNWEIHRLRPDLSNVPEELAALDPAFWKPTPAAKPKPTAEKSAEKK